MKAAEGPRAVGNMNAAEDSSSAAISKEVPADTLLCVGTLPMWMKLNKTLDRFFDRYTIADLMIVPEKIE